MSVKVTESGFSVMNEKKSSQVNSAKTSMILGDRATSIRE